MLEERLSTIERMHRRDEERRRLGGAVPAFVKPRPSPGPEQLAEAERQRQAGALPEDLFAGDEELQCLRTVYETRRAIRAEQRICLRALECAQQALADQGKTLRQLIVAAAIGSKEGAPAGDDKAWKKHSRHWFKSEEGGRELAQSMVALGAWEAVSPQVLPLLNAILVAAGLPAKDKLAL